MDYQWIVYSLATLLILTTRFPVLGGDQGTGVNYGLQSDNLPQPDQVVSLLKSKGIMRVRIFDPVSTILEALKGSGIEVVLGVSNTNLADLANDPSFATNWVKTNVLPYVPDVHFRYVAAGNEVIPGGLAQTVLPGLQNLQKALRDANVDIPVTTSVFLTLLGESFPPSKGAFSEEAAPTMEPLVKFLNSNKYPLLVSVYPNFAMENDKNIRLDYATFNTSDEVVKDGPLSYNNLFDAMVDAMYSAIERAGGEDVEVVVSESGWPSDGDNGVLATITNAETYNNNLIAHVVPNTGTPKRPGKSIETYVFALFNENLKPSGTEQHWGLYYPNMTEVYRVNFTP